MADVIPDRARPTWAHQNVRAVIGTMISRSQVCDRLIGPPPQLLLAIKHYILHNLILIHFVKLVYYQTLHSTLEVYV